MFCKNLLFSVFSVLFIAVLMPCFVVAQRMDSLSATPLTKERKAAIAKDTNGIVTPSVRIKARALENKIMLRWAVDQPEAWRQVNNYGFNIERYTVAKDGKALQKPIRKALTPTPLKPKPVAEWKDLTLRDDRAAIIAQGIFGDNFGVSSGKKSDVAKMLAQSDELTQRFTFSLMAADQSFEAATMAGWAYTDATVQKGEKYYYRIAAAIPSSIMKVDTSGLVIGLSDFYTLPRPVDVLGNFTSKNVMISWDNKLLSDLYTSYYVEKSEDSIHYTRLSNLPIMNLNSSGGEAPSRMFCNDTLEVNDKIYYYRVFGITCFGELSPPSDTMRGIGQDKLSFSPNIMNFEMPNDSTVTLEWAFFKEDSLDLLHHFELRLSDRSEDTGKVVIRNIAKTARKITYTGLMASNYFTICAIDKYGKSYNSYSQLVQPVDSIPPSVPIGLEGIVNDSGRVILTWQPNTEKDIYGYHVFRGNISGEEKSLLTKAPITTTEFVDSVSMDLTNSKVFYAIVALDQRFNQSKMSPVVAVTKPDKIPPMTPVFSDYKLSEGKVDLTWINSASDDVVMHRLFKHNAADVEAAGQWALVKEFAAKDSITAFSDTTAAPNSTVSYTLIAIDKSKNESTPSVPLRVTVPVDKKNKAGVKDLKAVADRQSKQIAIDWVYEESGVVEFQIFKTYGKIPISLWKVAEKTDKAVIDTDVTPSNVYKYAVRAVFGDGRMSAWREVKVTF